MDYVHQSDRCNNIKHFCCVWIRTNLSNFYAEKWNSSEKADKTIQQFVKKSPREIHRDSLNISVRHKKLLLLFLLLSQKCNLLQRMNAQQPGTPCFRFSTRTNIRHRMALHRLHQTLTSLMTDACFQVSRDTTSRISLASCYRLTPSKTWDARTQMPAANA